MFGTLLAMMASMALAQAPTPVINSPTIPSDVSIPTGATGNPIAFFDDYSWRAFIALVWPAKAGQRGIPDTTTTIDGAGPGVFTPRVFDTFKTSGEVFHNDGSAPTDWNAYDPPTIDSCGATSAFGDLHLASFSKFSQLGEAGVASLTGNLVSQNGQYIRYSTGFNKATFDQIVGPKWYLRSNLPATITFDNGSLTIKAAWMVMDGVANPNRYYTRPALVMDPTTGVCAAKTVGLIGLHIVQKTPTRPQWIWSSFEHIDNVPPAPAGGPGQFNLNDGTGTPMPSSNPLTPANQALNPPPTRTPYNVTRVLPIADPTSLMCVLQTTSVTNQKYQAAIRSAKSDSVWQFYQLVMTQWPLIPNNPALPGTPVNTFPGTGATTAFSNVALETWEQKSVFTSCMACHNNVMKATDFVFSLNDHAFPTLTATPNLMSNEGLQQLRNLLMSTRRSEKGNAPK